MEVSADLAHLEHAPDVADRIMRKRQADLERRARFFDAKVRQKGVDRDALDSQVAVKLERKAAEAEIEQAYAETAVQFDQACAAVEFARAQEKKDREAAAKDFSAVYLRKELRREYALSDPLQLKKDLPARVGDDDPRCGPASMQKFDSEILQREKADNKKFYQEQQKQWLFEQMAAKQAAKERERQEQMLYDEQVLTATGVRGLIDAHAMQATREQKMAEANANLALAAEQRTAMKNKKEWEAAQAQNHAMSTVTSTRLGESFDHPTGANGRLLRDEYKRCSQEEEQAVYDANATQIAEKRRAAMIEKEAEVREADRTLQATAVLSAVEQEQAKIKAERRRLLDAENSIIAEAQRNLKQHQRTVYGGEVKESFFDSFNTSAR